MQQDKQAARECCGAPPVNGRWHYTSTSFVTTEAKQIKRLHTNQRPGESASHVQKRFQDYWPNWWSGIKRQTELHQPWKTDRTWTTKRLRWRWACRSSNPVYKVKLKCYLESRQKLSLSSLRQVLRTHFIEKDATELYHSLTRAVQEPKETPMQFLICTMDLRQKVLFASERAKIGFKLQPWTHTDPVPANIVDRATGWCCMCRYQALPSGPICTGRSVAGENECRLQCGTGEKK